MTLNRELADYSIALTTYEAAHQLPTSFFRQPDHLAIKTADIKQFEETVRSLSQNAEQMTCVEEDNGRFRVAAKVLGAFSLGIYGRVNWLEIIEADSSGIDHAEFYYPDFSNLRRIFDRRQVNYEMDKVGSHRSAYVHFSRQGHDYEFRISDTPVAVVVEEEIDNGEAIILAA